MSLARGRYAIKIIRKQPGNSGREQMLSEIAVLQRVRHPHVLRLVEVFETRAEMYVVTELLTGGELFDRIMAEGVFSEQKASRLVTNLVEGVAYLHRQGIVHRDLKPENLLLASEDPGSVRIADFGLSTILSMEQQHGGELLHTACGTPGYVAPEIIAHEGYTAAVDMWSVGVIIYILLCGFPPFYGDSESEVFAKVAAIDFEFKRPYWDDVSDMAKDLICSLLVKAPNRLTAEQTLKHPWLSRPEDAPNIDLPLAKENIRSLVTKRRFSETTEQQNTRQQHDDAEQRETAANEEAVRVRTGGAKSMGAGGSTSSRRGSASSSKPLSNVNHPQPGQSILQPHPKQEATRQVHTRRQSDAGMLPRGSRRGSHTRQNPVQSPQVADYRRLSEPEQLAAEKAGPWANGDERSNPSAGSSGRTSDDETSSSSSPAPRTNRLGVSPLLGSHRLLLVRPWLEQAEQGAGWRADVAECAGDPRVSQELELPNSPLQQKRTTPDVPLEHDAARVAKALRALHLSTLDADENVETFL